MTLGHDDGLRVKRPSGISPASIVREGKDRPELFFPRSQVPPAEGIGAPVRPGRLSCPGVRADWLAPEPPMSPGGVCLDPHGQAQNSHPTDIGQTLGSHVTRRGVMCLRVPWGRDHLGKASVSALGLKEGVGFNPE